MQENNYTNHFIVFSILYYLGINLSIFIMPLYFNENNAVKIYGLAYASMSIAGIFAIFLGKIVDKFNWITTLTFSILIYALALLGRIITNEYLAVLIAFIAGLAASTGVLSLKNWMAYSAQSTLTNRLVLYRSLIFHSTNLFSMVFVLGLAYVTPNKSHLYWSLLVLSAIIVFFAWLFFLKIRNNYHVDQHQNKTLSKIKFNPIILLFSLNMIFSGCYSGLIKPYLILLFIRKGFSDEYSISINLLIVFAQVIFTTIVIKKLNFFSKFPIKLLICLEIALLLIYLFLYFEYSEMSIFVLLFIFILRTFLLSTSTCTEEIIHMQYISKEQFASVFGLLLTLFLVGDSFGAFISSFVFNHNYLNIFLISAGFVLFNLCTYILLNFAVKKHHHIE